MRGEFRDPAKLSDCIFSMFSFHRGKFGMQDTQCPEG
jgi:hypothetical protein